MSTHQPLPCPPEPDDAAAAAAIIRLADHTIGLWRAAQEVGDPVLLAALRPLVVQVARSLARDLMEDVAGETAH